MNMSSQRVVVVTGGTSGIGLAIAKRHLEAGDRVVIGSLDVNEATVAELGLDPERVRCLRVDVGVPDDVQSMIDAAVSEFGRLDVLVNNAGIGDGGLLVRDFDANRTRLVSSVLFEGLAQCMKFAAQVMVPRGSGSIINIASIAGISTHINSDHIYSALKAAVVQLTKTSALELAPIGVRVNCVCPGYIATPLFGRDLGYSGDKLKKSVEIASQVFADLQPLRRAGRPEDIANASFWLSSEEAAFVAGHVMVVDGAASLGGTFDPDRGRGTVISRAMEKLNNLGTTE
jgi:NAD(P)-dependent dehydrogenase (short-subunit alcohol dehydrogenase family)